MLGDGAEPTDMPPGQPRQRLPLSGIRRAGAHARKWSRPSRPAPVRRCESVSARGAGTGHNRSKT